MFRIFVFVFISSVLCVTCVIFSEATHAVDSELHKRHRRLQFDGMFDTEVIVSKDKVAGSRKAKRGPGKSGKRGRAGAGGLSKLRSRVDASGEDEGTLSEGLLLKKTSEDITMNTDRYNLWWTGPPDSDTFKPAPWGAMHTENQNVIFTMAVIQGMNDRLVQTPHDLLLFLGSARRYFNGDIVMAIESGLSPEAKDILIRNRVVVYEIPDTLCSKATDSIFCGVEEERVPASVFRYFFYEKWASRYNAESLILLADFRDIIFQADPFEYKVRDWFPDAQLVLFQEFFPNMVIGRCRFNRRVMQECYGDEALRQYGPRVIISSGSSLGTRDAIIVWSHAVTSQLQEAPGRLVETQRCTTGGIDHAFINWMVYANKLNVYGMKIKLFAQGEGAMNTLGGLKPDTVVANLTGPITTYWKILQNGDILNWNGDRSPVVHQLEHFVDEMIDIVDHQHLENDGVDKEWQAIRSTRCLWGCTSSSILKV
jgi:hypothetical protein